MGRIACMDLKLPSKCRDVRHGLTLQLLARNYYLQSDRPDPLIKGGSPCFLCVVKLDSEIAVDQQTKTHDQTFEGVPESGCPMPIDIRSADARE